MSLNKTQKADGAEPQPYTAVSQKRIYRSLGKNRGHVRTAAENSGYTKRTETDNAGLPGMLAAESRGVRKKPLHHVKKASAETVKIIPLGGLEEIGMNMTAFEYGGTIIVVDCGISFPGVK